MQKRMLDQVLLRISHFPAVSHQEAHAEGPPRPGGGLVLVHPGVVEVRPPQVLQESRVHHEYVHVGRYNEVRVGHEG